MFPALEYSDIVPRFQDTNIPRSMLYRQQSPSLGTSQDSSKYPGMFWERPWQYWTYLYSHIVVAVTVVVVVMVVGDRFLSQSGRTEPFLRILLPQWQPKQ